MTGLRKRPVGTASGTYGMPHKADGIMAKGGEVVDDLRKRLAEGPGSRELSDDVLEALGWYQQKDLRLSPDSWLWFAPGDRPILWTGERPNVSESTDDALALVGEYDSITTSQDKNGAAVLITKGDEHFVGDAKGENPLPRAICLAVLPE